MPVRISVATVGFKQPLKQALQTAVDMGAHAVQLDAWNELRPASLTESGRREFLHLLDELGLKVASLYLPTRRTLSEMEDLEGRLATIKSAMQFAYQLRSNVLALRIGRIPTDPLSREYELLRQVLGDLAAYSNHVGTTLAILPTHDSPETLHQLTTSVTEGMLGIDFDPAGFIIGGHKPPAALRLLHASVVHMQARDAVRDIDGGGAEVTLGRGEVNWDEFVAGVEEIEYRGWVTVTRTQGDDRLDDIERAVSYLRQITFQ